MSPGWMLCPLPPTRKRLKRQRISWGGWSNQKGLPYVLFWLLLLCSNYSKTLWLKQPPFYFAVACVGQRVGKPQVTTDLLPVISISFLRLSISVIVQDMFFFFFTSFTYHTIFEIYQRCCCLLTFHSFLPHNVWRLKIWGWFDSWGLESLEGSFTCMTGTWAWEDFRISCADLQGTSTWLAFPFGLASSLPGCLKFDGLLTWLRRTPSISRQDGSYIATSYLVWEII